MTLLLLDVDGVLTDGRIHIDNGGVETKTFDVTDGHGLKMLLRAGVEVGFVTGRQSLVVEHRARELGVTEYHRNCSDNMHEALATLGITVPWTPSPLNLFMNVPVDGEGRLDRVPPTSRPGDHVLLRAARNVDGFQICLSGNLNGYGALWAEKLVFTKAAIAQLTQRLGDRR